jgi:hypothetical protein
VRPGRIAVIAAGRVAEIGVIVAVVAISAPSR